MEIRNRASGEHALPVSLPARSRPQIFRRGESGEEMKTEVLPKSKIQLGRY